MTRPTARSTTTAARSHLYSSRVAEAGVVVSSPDIDVPLTYFAQHGFRVERIFPADDPRSATLVGHGTRIHLETSSVGSVSTGHVRIRVDGVDVARTDCLDDGTTVEWLPSHENLVVPPLVSSFVLTGPSDGWHTGRAGMQYRDLVPDRQGNAVIASHIRIPTAGPVPDYVHFHDVVFQLIFCHRGWVKVVYEDQGEPFVLHAGDCVIQPPQIRHRVLESSDEMHVVEIGYPADHVTYSDPTTSLPTPSVRRDRVWSGQKFVHFESDAAEWRTMGSGWTKADTGVRDATGGVAHVTVHRASDAHVALDDVSDGEFRFFFVLRGHAAGTVEDRSIDAPEATSAVIPPRSTARLSGTFELLEVSIPTH